jgi:hypothetical protein
VALAIAVAVVAPAQATTLVRADLEDLVAGNARVLVAEVVDVESRWNDEGTFIFTDVRVRPLQFLKGRSQQGEMTVTLMGGTVADLTTLIIGGAELIPGRAYVLFLNNEQLPGIDSALTVRDHCQGAFDLVLTKGGLRAVSQATRQPLVPNAFGEAAAPGGLEGIPFEAMVQSIRDLENRQQGARQEVK